MYEMKYVNVDNGLWVHRAKRNGLSNQNKLWQFYNGCVDSL